MNVTAYDAIFSSIIGHEYDTLKLICPAATEMSRLVGEAVKIYSTPTESLQIVELGGGTGITTLAMLSARPNLHVLSIDNEPVMQDQAKKHLQQWIADGHLNFCSDDALTALQNLPENSADIIASAYTLHNFLISYREQVIKEIYRVLKPNGQFINGDRYALNDTRQHTRAVQDEISQYFKVLIPLDRSKVLEQWIVHLFNDESQDHIMRESIALQQLHDFGFSDIKISDRINVNALVKAKKP
ncbi:MAG: class I SAM-dependent methyltransferase [Methylococcales bacterium]|jgi:ubiquinone/menaquinone biosynthesis C-methylase UbiE